MTLAPELRIVFHLDGWDDTAGFHIPSTAGITEGQVGSAVVPGTMRSMSYLLDAPVAFRSAPDLFCLDLYKEFDLDRLAALAEPTKLTMKYLGPTSK